MNENQTILKLSDAQVTVHTKLYRQQISDIEAKINELLSEKKVYEDLLQSLTGRGKAMADKGIRITSTKVTVPSLYGTENYDPSWSIAKKAAYVIREMQKPLSTRDICNLIRNREVNILAEKDIDFNRFQKNVASTLSQKFEKGTGRPLADFIKIDDNGLTKYGLKQEAA